MNPLFGRGVVDDENQDLVTHQSHLCVSEESVHRATMPTELDDDAKEVLSVIDSMARQAVENEKHAQVQLRPPHACTLTHDHNAQLCAHGSARIISNCFCAHLL